MGSGFALKKAYKKYGIENFKKEILHYFNDELDMYEFEEKYVDERLVNDRNCYNLMIGGKNKKSMSFLNDLAKDSDHNAEVKRKRKEGIYRYWHTGDIEEKKRKCSDGVKRYWSTGNVKEKKKKHSEILKKMHSERPEIRNKIKASLDKYWNEGEKELKRKKHGELVKNSAKYKKGIETIKEKGEQKGYNNRDFQQRWKLVYDKHCDEICEMLMYSNLPESFLIKNIFKMNIKMPRFIKYAQHIKKLPNAVSKEKKYRFLRFDNKDGKGHKDGGSLKTIFTNEIKYPIVFLYDDFFEQFKTIVGFMLDDSLSDSAILNVDSRSNQVPNFYQVIEYFSEIGVVSNVHYITVRTDKTVGGSNFTVPAKKTKFDVDFNNVKVNLLDKELNEYGIDDNGKAFLKGRFELGNNGKKCFL